MDKKVKALEGCCCKGEDLNQDIHSGRNLTDMKEVELNSTQGKFYVGDE